jgi:hypothetical protein
MEIPVISQQKDEMAVTFRQDTKFGQTLKTTQDCNWSFHSDDVPPTSLDEVEMFKAA